MTTGHTGMTGDREWISALVDGALEASEFDQAMQRTAGSEAHECWHVYQLIGDVLRAPDLAACDRGSAYVDRLRQDWLREGRPVLAAQSVTVPAAEPGLGREAANDGVFRWKLVAGLASFAAVAALGWNLFGAMGPQLGDGRQVMVEAVPTAAETPRTVLAASGSPSATAQTEPAEGQLMWRDPQLDQFLAAHRQATGVQAFGGSASFLRNATFDGPSR